MPAIMKEIGDIIKKYKIVIKSIRHKGKRTQALEDLEKINGIINSLDQIAIQYNIQPINGGCI